jgi:serine protease Do
LDFTTCLKYQVTKNEFSDNSMSPIEVQITDTVALLQESVVSIGSVRLARDFRYGTVPLEGQGTGVIVDEKGYIVTNNHVVEGAERVQVTLKDGRTFTGEVVGADRPTDVALVRVDTSDLRAAKLGDSEHLKVGQIVLAIGNALGLPGAPTVSMGVVSAIGRPLPGADFLHEGMIQTDASINPGNSGGPLVDLEGNVIGINSAMIAFAQAVGFSIPVHTVKQVVGQILQHGRVIRPWLGISGLDVKPEFAKRYGMPVEAGVLLAAVTEDGAAFEAGLREGDILVQVNEAKVNGMKDLVGALSKEPIGGVAKIVVMRMGRRVETSVRLSEAPQESTPRIRSRGR